MGTKVTTATPWPFAPLTEAQLRAQAAQACALRNIERRAHHARVNAALEAWCAATPKALQHPHTGAAA